MTTIDSKEQPHCRATSFAEYKYYQESSIHPDHLRPGHLAVFMSSFKNLWFLQDGQEAAVKFAVSVKSFEVRTLEFNGHNAVGAIVNRIFSCSHKRGNYFDLSDFSFENESVKANMSDGYLRDWDEAVDGEIPVISASLDVPKIEEIKVPDCIPQQWEIDVPIVEPQPSS